MGKVNLKLMQGIEDAEEQIAKDKKKESHICGHEDLKKEKTNDSQNIQQSMTVLMQPEYDSNLNKSMNKNLRKQVFSFRALIQDIDVWKAYATATGQTMEYIGAAAMNEYIDNHRLSEMEQDIFAALRVRNEKRK